MPPDPVRTFAEVSKVETPYYILYGTLEFNTRKLPRAVDQEAQAIPTPDPVDARFDGAGLTLEGFTTEFAGDVVLQPTCAGPWCGQAQAGVPSLMFGAVNGDTITIVADACSTWIFPEPSQAQLDAMTDCINGRSCEPEPDL